MKKTKEHVYEFNEKYEIILYDEIGKKNSAFKSYCEWYSYVYGKYGGRKYTRSTLENFVHYLKREKNIIVGKKETLGSCIIPFLTVFITVVYTLVFSIVNVINTYNNAINTMVDDEFMQYTGYSVEMIYEALEQNLYSGMSFFALSAVIICLLVIWFLYIVSLKIRSYNMKNEFYSDYIMIIKSIIEEQI